MLFEIDFIVYIFACVDKIRRKKPWGKFDFNIYK